ncbi:hypothetical protein MPTK1_1g10610 [Marchantia polymorpha subsp. ruderalis]|uniref:Uncharacterized protein n=2 Tax=Marchantia polymorpha TaxID=3197 RepID=A0AAF6ANQ1_MARPO|nr:hypothetical protein MARPO_0014s0166 [Marchantia polymorpha]BBM98071.1 hypothetical protein Mp_1g10610 [Marchantia polymorpha subsp. ruderalis]|eukprot:PTQ45655.1 hypothetical protein MARPO_0014s0166 [Marchantia polymorpha]
MAGVVRLSPMLWSSRRYRTGRCKNFRSASIDKSLVHPTKSSRCNWSHESAHPILRASTTLQTYYPPLRRPGHWAAQARGSYGRARGRAAPRDGREGLVVLRARASRRRISFAHTSYWYGQMESVACCPSVRRGPQPSGWLRWSAAGKVDLARREGGGASGEEFWRTGSAGVDGRGDGRISQTTESEQNDTAGSEHPPSEPHAAIRWSAWQHM